MKSFCQTEGHSYIHTAEGKSVRCIECHNVQMPWHIESEASVNAGKVMMQLKSVA